MLWRENGSLVTAGYSTFGSKVNDTSMAGMFRTRLTDITGNTLTSTATLDSVNLEDDGKIISCAGINTEEVSKQVQVEGISFKYNYHSVIIYCTCRCTNSP